ncbi:Uncharacterised protein [Mycobacteroides abscessus subsp. abscessus]|nr:Uncharacterised protein [Mycobacteroides abscessus subsp. abscessus]
MRDTVDLAVELCVGETRIAVDECIGVGDRCGALGEQSRHRGVGEPMEWTDERNVRLEREIEGGNRGVEVATDQLQCVAESCHESVGVAMVDQVVSILESEPNRCTRCHHERQRVMGVVQTALADDVVQRRLLALLFFGSEVLQDVEDVEQHRMLGLLLKAGQSDVVVGHQLYAGILTAAQEVSHRLLRMQHRSHGDGVEEQPDHGVEAGNLCRTAGDGGTERDVGDSEDARQREGQGPRDDGVECDARRPRVSAE